MSPNPYRGRFAPSPTGPLHFGSLVAAVASYADARNQRGDWLVRIEDVDEVRCRSDHERAILTALLNFGMQWDEPPVRQSERKSLYRQAIANLSALHLAYRCVCSRKTIATNARAGRDGSIYSGRCRQRTVPKDRNAAIRVIVDDSSIAIIDLVYGKISQTLSEEVGDFVIQRADGFAAYQLAVVVDDGLQDISRVVRGADLLWSTPRQRYLQGLLGYTVPQYAHIPLVVDTDGRKLSKRDAAHPVDDQNPLPALLAAWRFLGQREPPTGLRDVNAFWRWATPEWKIQQVPTGPENKIE